jgi:hypothetical protein
MYAWIWRHIPFRRWQLKALVSAVLIGTVGALLWYRVFPAVEPLLPFDDVRVETTNPNDDLPGGNLEQQLPQSPAATTGNATRAPQQLPS